jgi:hypothetical protein
VNSFRVPSCARQLQLWQRPQRHSSPPVLRSKYRDAVLAAVRECLRITASCGYRVKSGEHARSPALRLELMNQSPLRQALLLTRFMSDSSLPHHVTSVCIANHYRIFISNLPFILSIPMVMHFSDYSVCREDSCALPASTPTQSGWACIQSFILPAVISHPINIMLVLIWYTQLCHSSAGHQTHSRC